MNEISSVAVFCGSRVGIDPAFAAAATELGTGMAHAGIRLVYGGGKNGIMGILADSVLAAGGQVLGVIPDFLTKWEVAHPNVTELVITSNMHDRKRRMAEEADAFVALPGGIGTLDEIIEIISWRMLRLHDKPIYICDIAGWAGPLLTAFDGAITRGFAGADARSLFTVVDSVPYLLERLGHAPHGSSISGARL